jgi:hypothetical protein
MTTTVLLFGFRKHPMVFPYSSTLGFEWSKVSAGVSELRRVSHDAGTVVMECMVAYSHRVLILLITHRIHVWYIC